MCREVVRKWRPTLPACRMRSTFGMTRWRSLGCHHLSRRFAGKAWARQWIDGACKKPTKPTLLTMREAMMLSIRRWICHRKAQDNWRGTRRIVRSFGLMRLWIAGVEAPALSFPKLSSPPRDNTMSLGEEDKPASLPTEGMRSLYTAASILVEAIDKQGVERSLSAMASWRPTHGGVRSDRASCRRVARAWRHRREH